LLRHSKSLPSDLLPTIAPRIQVAGDAQPLLNAFTVDVEDYFQVSAFERDIDRRTWNEYPLRVERNTLRLLELLADHDVTATFFVVGWIADRCPGLVTEIHNAGHEIGSHSYWHRLVYQQTPKQFRDDLVRSRDVLENILGEAVRVFRAPSFSITQSSQWALEILVEEGFQIDSSIFPVYHDRYGLPRANPAIHRLETAAGSLWECPLSVIRIAGLNLPISGGGYFRLYPQRLTCRWLHSVNHRWHRPFVFYVHPWEIDPDQPRMQVGTRLSRWRHYVNLARTQSKLEALLKRFCFGSLTEVLASQRLIIAPNRATSSCRNVS
jgi:polysaccharide deacetylase family protein (PEP-CTERM system associated)